MNILNFLFVTCLAVIAAGFLTSLFQWLWNITMPQMFGMKYITFWLAFRLLLIAGFLTSGSFIRINWNK